MCCLSIPLPEYPASTMDNHANERIWNVPGDGNCLFRALVLAAEDKNILSMPITHVSLRAMAVALVRNDVDGHLVPFNVMTSEESRDSWVARMSRDAVFGDVVAIQACSILLDVAIRVKQGEYTLQRVGDRQLYGTRNELVLQLRSSHYMVERWAENEVRRGPVRPNTAYSFTQESLPANVWTSSVPARPSTGYSFTQENSNLRKNGVEYSRA